MTWNRATSPAEEEVSRADTAAQGSSRSRETVRQVLVVEDDAADRRLIEDAIESYPSPVDTTIVGDGDRAIEALTTATAPFALVLLDLHLPGSDGRVVLEHVRARHALTELPIVVLSSLASDADALHCYELGANALVAKPFDLDGFRDVIHRILAYWLSFQPTATDVR